MTVPVPISKNRLHNEITQRATDNLFNLNLSPIASSNVDRLKTFSGDNNTMTLVEGSITCGEDYAKA